jgi:hypothetical protein
MTSFSGPFAYSFMWNHLGEDFGPLLQIILPYINKPMPAFNPIPFKPPLLSIVELSFLF